MDKKKADRKSVKVKLRSSRNSQPSEPTKPFQPSPPTFNLSNSAIEQDSFSQPPQPHDNQPVADEEDIVVFIGGVYQIPDTNYTVSGNQITFGSAPPQNDGASNDHIITIIHGLHKLGE